MKNKIMMSILSIALFTTNSVFGMMNPEEQDAEEQDAASRQALLKKLKKTQKFITQADDKVVSEVYKVILQSDTIAPLPPLPQE